MGELRILDASGDRKVTWTHVKAWLKKHPERHEQTRELVKEPDDLTNARRMFEQNVALGYDSYEFDKPGDITTGRKITKFNPLAKFIVQTPHLSPGK